MKAKIKELSEFSPDYFCCEACFSYSSDAFGKVIEVQLPPKPKLSKCLNCGFSKELQLVRVLNEEYQWIEIDAIWLEGD